jgi:hypothetical protein
MNHPAASSGVLKGTLIMVAASGGEYNPSGQHPELAIISSNRVIPSGLWVLSRLNDHP